MKITRSALAVCAAPIIVILAAGTAGAQEQRYQLEKTENGYVRMDTRTGEMSICEEKSAQLVCRVAADERTAMQDEVDRLRGDVSALHDRVIKLENSLSARLESKLPSDEEFEKTMGYMERFFRSFMGIVKEQEADKPSSPAPLPNKT
ncbi:hypothetical protein [Oryzicola mucosus]|uniref:Uncharacterized protein n=1 Tax=Oryzicola mucosus TaxID=2767425 RepID=A0A8J6PLH6_9HYPH|nr:hypothetical protein [Oryzicola mucosus]MBD0413235.1 hypothetical protein [Oryzicola mucosus]